MKVAEGEGAGTEETGPRADETRIRTDVTGSKETGADWQDWAWSRNRGHLRSLLVQPQTPSVMGHDGPNAGEQEVGGVIKQKKFIVSKDEESN